MSSGKIVISGASGDLGRKITREVIRLAGDRELALVTRTPDALAELVSDKVSTHYGDYTDPASLEQAYTGGEVLMLISGLSVTKRVPEHRNAIAAAKKAGIRHIVYTSVAGIHPQNPTLSASDHLVTEADLRASGLSFSVLRNATYADILATLVLQPFLRTGRWESASGEGLMAPVAKDDIALCAAKCLLDPEFHGGAVYEISGPELMSFRDMAAMASEIHGTPIEYITITPEEKLAQLDALGVPRSYDPDQTAHPDMHFYASDEIVSAEIAFAQNYHAILSGHVEFITGRKPRPIREIMEECKDQVQESL